MSDEVVVKVDVKFPMGRVRDLLCCAFEGGSNYWYMIEKFHSPPGGVTVKCDHGFGKHDVKVSGTHEVKCPECGKATCVFRHLDYPTAKGGYLIVSDGKENDKPVKAMLNIESLSKGLQVMAEKYPRHFSSFMEQNEDAETGDVFLQCCLFGELVYG